MLGRLADADGLPEAVIVRVEALIESTSTHQATGQDGVLMSDIDLAILGSPPAPYQRFEQAIRMEYSVFDDETYCRGRRAVLRRFLDRPRIYQSNHF